MNQQKQNRKMVGLKVCELAALASLKIDTVLISTRSQLTKSYIVKDAHQAFPAAKINFFYP